jgi:peptidoglycan/xylan/chitin deacetylase (PgdA/CDA1 family)
MRRLLAAFGILLLFLSGVAVAVAASRPHPTAAQAASQLERAAVADVWQSRYPVYCGGGRQRLVALTFDDGPGRYTGQILKTLRAYDAPATFFEIGRQVTAEAARAEERAGAVGNHTWDHPKLTALSSRQVSWEIAATRARLDQFLVAPTQLFRAPGGTHDARIDALVHAEGLVLVGWSLDSNDWRVKTGGEVYDNINVAALRPGAIVLMHEIHPQDLAALPRVLALLERLHLTPVSVPALLALDPPTAAELAQDAAAKGCVHLNRLSWPKPRPLPPPWGPPVPAAKTTTTAKTTPKPPAPTTTATTTTSTTPSTTTSTSATTTSTTTTTTLPPAPTP